MTAAELKDARLALGLSRAAMSEKIGRSPRQYKAYELGEFAIPLAVEMAVKWLQASAQQPEQKDAP